MNQETKSVEPVKLDPIKKDAKVIERSALVIRTMMNALVNFGSRKCPDLNSDLKFARLITWLRPLAQDIDKVRSQAERLAADGLESNPERRLDVANFLMTVQLAEFDRQMHTLSDPPYRVKRKDLPKDMAGTEGWRNAASIGTLVADLDFLYVDDEPIDD